MSTSDTTSDPEWAGVVGVGVIGPEGFPGEHNMRYGMLIYQPRRWLLRWAAR
jgi:hypothetical protein